MSGDPHTRIIRGPSQTYLLFSTSANPLSNRFQAKFDYETGSQMLTFRSVTQALAYNKANFAGDKKSKLAILDQKLTYRVKAIEKRISNSPDENDRSQTFGAFCIENLPMILIEKFTQNRDILKYLFLTRGMRLADASLDEFYGIGMNISDGNVMNLRWPGSNYLGLAMEALRDELWDDKEYRLERIGCETLTPEEIEERLMKPKKYLEHSEAYFVIYRTLSVMPVRIQQSQDDGSPRYLFFFGPDAPFSTFHIAEFQVPGEFRVYNCVEQYFAYKKAEFCGEYTLANAIMQRVDPVNIKQISNIICMPSDILLAWQREMREIMRNGFLAKFTQHSDLRLSLFRAYDMEFVNSMPRGNLWGIGLPMRSPDSLKRALWRGANLLGTVMNEVCDELFNRPEYREEREQVLQEPLSRRIHMLSRARR